MYRLFNKNKNYI